jgi:hypothetical protein
MPKKNAAPSLDPKLLVVAYAVYHVAALIKDFEACVRNWNNYKKDRSGANLLRLALAEGVFIKDLGLGW